MLQKWKGKLQCHRFYMKWFHGPVQLPDHHSDARRGWQPYKNMFPRDLQILCWTQLAELLALLPCVNESRIVIIVMAPNFDKKVMGESCPLGHPRWSKKEKRKLGPKSRPKSGTHEEDLEPLKTTNLKVAQKWQYSLCDDFGSFYFGGKVKKVMMERFP